MMPDPFSNSGLPLKGGVSKMDPTTLPGYVPDKLPDMDKFRVRILKIDLDDLGSISELEVLQTRALRNDGITILSKERFTFLEKMFIIVEFVEKIPA